MNPDLSSTRLKKAKHEVRTWMRAARDAVPEARRAELGARAVERLLAMPEMASAGTVMAFWSFGSEVPTEPLLSALHERHVRLVLPRVEDGDLVPRAFSPGDPTTGTSFGAREPSAKAPPVEPVAIDVVVTPALAFDRSGGRVGYGGGFYDRFFRRVPSGPFRLGLGFAMQVLDQDLPAGPSDLKVHAVVTDREIVRCVQPSAAT